MTEVSAFTAHERDQARHLDDDIRTAIAEIRGRWEDLQALLEKASQSHLHAILGYRSWTAYIADVFGETGPIRLDKTKRSDAIVSMTDDYGMPARAIAAVLGVSAVTVSKIVVANGAGNKKITGMNGAIYEPAVLRRKPPPPPLNPPPPPKINPLVEVVDEVGEEVESETAIKSRALMAEAKRLNTVLAAVASELEQLTLNYNFRTRRRYVMAELRPGITKLYDTVQGMATE